MKVLCVSVRLAALTSISDKAYKAEGFDGSSDIIPKSQVFGRDYEVAKSDAFWISEWIMRQKSLQFSHKKKAWFDKETRKMLPTYKVEKHTPNKRNPVTPKADATLTR